MIKRIIFLIFTLTSIFSTNAQDEKLAIQYYTSNEFLKAAKEFEKLIPIAEMKYGDKSDKLIKYNYLTARSYDQSKKLNEAINYYSKTLLTFESMSKIDYENQVFQQNLVFYMEALLSHTFELFLKEEYVFVEASLIKANNLFIKYNSIKIGKYTAFNKKTEYLISKGFAMLYRETGQLNKYKVNTDKALKIAKEFYGTENLGYLLELNNSATAYHGFYKFSESLKLCDEGIDLYLKGKHKIDNTYISLLSTKSSCLTKLNRNEEGIQIAETALELFERMENKDGFPNIQGSLLNGLGYKYYLNQEYNKSIHYFISALDIYNKIYPPTSLKIANVKYNLANTYSNKGDFEKAKVSYLSSLNTTLDNLKKNLFYMTEEEKRVYLMFELNLFFSSINSFALKYYDKDNTIIETVYNNLLVQKNLILRSTISVRESVLNSNNNELIKKFKELTELRNKISELYGYESNESEQRRLRLEDEANILEKNITITSLEYNSYKDNLNVTWNDIESALKPNEAAIEFVHFEYYDKEWLDKTYYCALILKPNGRPELIFLFEEKELLNLLQIAKSGNQKAVDDLYSEKSGLYDLIWKPLEKKLNGVSKVHLSLSGALNKISFGSLKNENGNHLSKNLDILQYNSTADILGINNSKTQKYKRALLVGGIDYGEKSKEWNYLPGTKKEVESIKDIFDNHNILSQLLTSEQASEANFIQGASNNDIIHISTHGYFTPESSNIKVSKIKEYGEVIFERTGISKNNSSQFTNPLLRSGLVFASSKNNFTNEKASISILNALEVSNLNLSGTKLVTLSACETGLGAIENREGVYGLQRSFKIAGAENLIFSLWRIPDIETQIFMSTFYEKLFELNSITMAFNETQRIMSSRYSTYYWGAFVLIQ